MTGADRGGAVAAAVVLGVALVLAAGVLGYLLGSSAIRFKEYERTVVVKGLAEREVPADRVIWPIPFTATDNDLASLYETLERSTRAIRAFLERHGIGEAEVTVSPPAVVDKLAQQYGGPPAEFRYTGNQTVTVHSSEVAVVRAAIADLATLGRSGIALTGTEYGNGIEYLFTRLNDVKPEMVEEATKNARQVAEKFAADSRSRLGKIKSARQGQFSINDRDRNNPHLKKVRVVSTVEYYLSD